MPGLSRRFMIFAITFEVIRVTIIHGIPFLIKYPFKKVIQLGKYLIGSSK